jgi:hypothetical protein
MVDFPKFLSTAGALYNLWPALFDWAVPGFFALFGIVATTSWWMRGYKAEAAEAGLKGQIDVLTQRLALSAEQQIASNEYAKKVENELAEYKAQAAKGADPKELELAIKSLESSVGNLITANNLVTSTLTIVVAEPTKDELELLAQKISQFSGTKFDVAGGGKTDTNFRYFDYTVGPALAKGGWVHIDWDWGYDTFQIEPYSKRRFGVVTGVRNVVVEAVRHGGPVNAADALANALNEIGIPATRKDANNENFNSNAVHILVGRIEFRPQ